MSTLPGGLDPSEPGSCNSALWLIAALTLAFALAIGVLPTDGAEASGATTAFAGADRADAPSPGASFAVTACPHAGGHVAPEGPALCPGAVPWHPREPWETASCVTPRCLRLR